MKAFKAAGRTAFDFLFPGPYTGRAAKLEGPLLRLEAERTSAPLERLLELQAHSPNRSAWESLGPIGYAVVKHFRPTRVVELGAFTGFSTFVFGLALRDLGHGGTVEAVDTWAGDKNTGAYTESVYQYFMDCRRTLGLEDIVKPLRMSFSEASRQIKPGIDLLHIDGAHTFRAVRRDFKEFRPLLKPGSIVMFHDMHTEFRGMRAFWRFLSLRYPSYLIPYGHGLGVIRLPD